MSDNFCEIIIVRHAESEWNINPARLQGSHPPGPPLTPLGRKQATALAIHLSKVQPCDAIYSSDLLRTAETAKQIHHYYHRKSQQEQQQSTSSPHPHPHHPPPPLHLLPELRERTLGVLTGLTHQEAQSYHPNAYAALSIQGPTPLPLPGDVEGMHDMTQRAFKVLESIASQHPGGRVVVVTHGGFISAVHRKVVGRFSYRTPNCSVGRLRIDPGSDDDDGKKKGGGEEGCSVWAVVSWGDVDHLKDADVYYEAAAFGGGTSG